MRREVISFRNPDMGFPKLSFPKILHQLLPDAPIILSISFSFWPQQRDRNTPGWLCLLPMPPACKIISS
jgi:hypothetical protein